MAGVKFKVKRTPKKALAEVQRIAKELNSAKGAKVRVGLPKDSNDYPDGTSVVMVGAVHEFGSPIRGVPQRSFLRSTVIENKQEYRDLFAKLGRELILGNIDMNKALSILGLQVQTDVRQKITDIKSPPLKEREGNPLVDTGLLRQSIVFEIKE